VDYGAAHYIDGWVRAIESRSEFVNIQTWDDFSENTAIGDSNTAGRAWIELTNFLANWFKLGRPPSIEKEVVMVFHPKQLVSAQLDQPDALVNSPRFRHRGPLVDYVDVVTILAAPAEVTLTVGAGEWKFSVPAGLREWTLYAPAQDDGSIVHGFEARPERFVKPASWRQVTRVPSIEASTPVVEVFRNKTRVLRLSSRVPYLDNGLFQDLTLIGDIGEVETERSGAIP
jgi:hypothetical protein